MVNKLWMLSICYACYVMLCKGNNHSLNTSINIKFIYFHCTVKNQVGILHFHSFIIIFIVYKKPPIVSDRLSHAPKMLI